MTNINLSETKPGEVYEGTVDGERLVLFRRSGVDSYPWESLDRLHDHADVSGLVRLVPARPITRDDLPEHDAIRDADDMHGTGMRSTLIEIALDAAVERLNANGGVPADPAEQLMREVNNPDPEKVALDEARIKANIERNEARRETDRLRRAHEIMEAERDKARRERDKWEEKYLDTDEALHQARDERDQYKRSGDEWRECHADAVRERDEWKSRAEDAEARTDPAVTREDVRGVIDYWIVQGGNHEALLDDLWRCVSGADPAVLVVRESDIAAVKVERDSHGEWFADGEHVYALGAADSRNLAGGYMQKAIRRLAVARAIEAEQATDPVEELAGQIETATREAIRQVCVDLAAVAPSLDPLTVERAMEVTAASRKVAAHILGQEAGDE